MLSVIIRQATSSDSDDLLSCLHDAFEPFRAVYSPAAFADTTLTRQTVRERLQEMHVLVALDSCGACVGTVAGVSNGHEGHIRGMAVRRRYAGAGVARRLLDAIEDELRGRGCIRVTLDTTEPLLRAMVLYERSGYRRTGRVADFFGMRLIEYAKDFHDVAV